MKYDNIKFFLGVAVKNIGLYKKALGYGMDNVLEPYRKDLITLEAELMRNVNCTVTYIQARLEKVSTITYMQEQ